MVASFNSLITVPLTYGADPEERFASSDVSWEDYESLLTKLENNSHYRVNYLDGILEIVSPSRRHEKVKTNLSTLVERFFYIKRIRYVPLGSSTFRNKAKQAGADSNECYCLGEEKEVPDLVIEVVVTSGSANKLEIYRRLGVAEVWFWEINQLKIYHLRDSGNLPKATVFTASYGYELITASELLPSLDIDLLERCITISDSILAVDEFEKGINP